MMDAGEEQTPEEELKLAFARMAGFVIGAGLLLLGGGILLILIAAAFFRFAYGG
jgi:hypothetical protein